jgi:hypothetical protein
MPGTLSEAQKQLVIQKGLKPSVIEKTFDQEKINKYFPQPAVTQPAPVIPAATQPAPVIPAPVIPAPVIPAPVIPAVTQPPQEEIKLPLVAEVPSPFFGPSKFYQETDVDVSRKVPTGASLSELSKRYIESRSLTPEGRISKELEDAATKKAETILKTSFTPGGEESPITAPFATSEAGIIGALKPQIIYTPEQEVSRRAIEKEATFGAIASLAEEYDRDIAVATGGEKADLIRRRYLLDNAPDKNRDFLVRKRELIEYESLKADALSKGIQLPPFKSSYKDKTVFDSIKTLAGELGTYLTTEVLGGTEPGGAIVESAPMYLGRLLSAVPSAYVGAVESIFSEKTLPEAVESRLRKGEGVMGAGLSIADEAIEGAGLPPDSTAATASRFLGGGAGLLIDFLLPVAPGFGSATAAIKAAAGTSKAERALGLSTSVVTANAAKNAARAAAGEAGRSIPFLSRAIAPEYGRDYYSKALDRYASNPENIEAMKDATAISTAISKEDLAKWNSEDFDKVDALDRAWDTVKGTRSESINDVLARTSNVGDLKDLDFHKSIRRDATEVLKRASLAKNLTPEELLQIALGSISVSRKEIKSLASFVDELSKSPDLKNDAVSLLKALASKIASKDPKLKIPSIDEVARQYLLGIADRALVKSFTASTSEGKIGRLADPLTSAAKASLLPRYIRLSRTSFVPEDKVASVLSQFSESVMGKLRNDIIGESISGDGTIFITSEEYAELIKLVGPTSIKAFEISPGGLGATIREAGSRAGAGLIPEAVVSRGKISINEKQWNVLAEKALDAIASKTPGYKNIFDVASDLENISDVSISPITSKNVYYSKVLTPKEVAGGTLETVIKSGVKRALDGAEASPKNPLSSEFLDQIGQRWGSIGEDFKSRYRQYRSAGLSAPDAWSRVIVENYILQAVPKIEEKAFEVTSEPGSTILTAPLQDIGDITRQSYNLMADDYIAMIYGGFESVVDAYNTTKRTTYLDKMLVPPFEMRKLTYVLGFHPYIKSLKKAFVTKATRGQWGEALVELRNIHAILQGRGMNQFIKSKAELKALYNVAKEADTLNVLDNISFETGGMRQGERGMFEIYNYAVETAPMFLVDDHLKLLSAQYLTRRQAGMVSDVYNDWAKIMPDLFPTRAGITENVERFKTLIQSYIPSMSERSSLITGLVKSAPETINVSVTPLQMKAAVDIIVNNISGNAPLLEKLYIALIEDSLTRLSSSEAAADSYAKTVGIFISEGNILKDVKIANETLATPADISEDGIKALTKLILRHPDFKHLMNSFSGAEDYVQAIYPKLRAETTPLFYDTLKTAIRSAARNNIAIVTRGPIEQAMTIPLVFRDTAAIKKSLLNRADLESFTDAMDEIAVRSTARKIENPDAQVLADSLDAAINEGLEATSGLRAGAASDAGISGNRFYKTLMAIIGSPASGFGDGIISKTAKSGVLGGKWLPNIRYFMANYLTAPAIIYGSIGKLVNPFPMFDYAVNSTMKALNSGIRGILDVRISSTMAEDLNNRLRGILDVKISPTMAKEEIVLTLPNGKVYTNYDIARLVSEGSIARSQASAELTTSVISDIMSFSGVEASKLLDKGIDGLSTIGRGQMREMLKQNFGLGADRAMNIFNEVGAYSDTMFRTKVLVDSLRKGDSEIVAMNLAREALFDYGNLSSIEKSFISKIFWFWTFRRNSYRQVLKSFLTNPARMKNAYAANGFLAEVDRDYNISTKDYANQRPFIFLVNDKESKQRYALYGAALPQLDATAQLIDYISLAMPLLNESLTPGEIASAVAGSTAMKIGEMASPLPQTLVALSFGVDIRRDAKELGYYLDPRLMAYLQVNDEMWNTFTSIINVEVVPPEEETPGRGTYRGRQWRIQKGDEASVRRWFAIQQLMVVAGIERSLRDWSPSVFAFRGDVEGETIPVQMGGQAEGRGLRTLLYTLGVVTPIEQPPLQDQIEFNRRALSEKFREGTYKQ